MHTSSLQYFLLYSTWLQLCTNLILGLLELATHGTDKKTVKTLMFRHHLYVSSARLGQDTLPYTRGRSQNCSRQPRAADGFRCRMEFVEFNKMGTLRYICFVYEWMDGYALYCRGSVLGNRNHQAHYDFWHPRSLPSNDSLIIPCSSAKLAERKRDQLTPWGMLGVTSPVPCRHAMVIRQFTLCVRGNVFGKS